MSEQNTIPLDAIGIATEINVPTTAFSKATLKIQYTSPVLQTEKIHTFEVNRSCPVLAENTSQTLPASTLTYNGSEERLTISESRSSTSLRGLYLSACNKCAFFTGNDLAAGCQGFRTPKSK